MHLHLPQASTEPHGCSKCHRKQLNHCTIQLASRVVIYSHVQLCQQSEKPITDNQGTRGCLTGLVNQPRQKQTEQPLALIHTQIVSGLMSVLNGNNGGPLSIYTYVRTCLEFMTEMKILCSSSYLSVVCYNYMVNLIQKSTLYQDKVWKSFLGIYFLVH